MADIYTAVQGSIQLISPWISKEVHLLTGVSVEVAVVKKELRSILAFLAVVDRTDHEEDEMVKEWVRQVRSLAHRMEDAIEKYKLLQKDDKLYNRVMHIWDKRSIACNIKDLREEAANIRTWKESYNWNRTPLTPLSMCMSMPEETGLVGAEAAEEDLIKLLGLLELEDSRPTTVAVTGKRGVGKTAVVWNVYNKRIVRDYFPIRAWVRVSQSYNCVDLQRSMYKQLIEAANEHDLLTDPDNNDTHMIESRTALDWIDSLEEKPLQLQINKFLKDKRYSVAVELI